MTTSTNSETDVLVLGAGPGGYTAAFRAADLGKKVTLVERAPVLGGVCLNVGCIPSKALLHAAKVIEDAADMASAGIGFSQPSIDLAKLRGWKNGIVGKLTSGLAALAKQRAVTVVHGVGRFTSPHEIEVIRDGHSSRIAFNQAVIAGGSEAAELASIPRGEPRIIDSTGALDLQDIPQRLLVIGGGVIGLEMATVYHALGSKITVVELADQLIPGADRDIVAPLMKRIKSRYERILLQTKVTKIEAGSAALAVTLDGHSGSETASFDKVLVAVGRTPNGKRLGLENAGVHVDDRGFIPVDLHMRTNVANIFAIGDIVGQPMLAHKAVHEGKIAAEVIAGMKSAFDAHVIPSVAYTDPEVAWAGLTEAEASRTGVAFGKGLFPWAASGRSLSLGRDEGLTKILFEKESGRIIGCGICGPNAGDLIAEAALAIEMKADAADLSDTIHPHPTLSETLAQAAEMFQGTITDLLPRRG
jgi:dihydrolipoamide dehydrogenase